MTMLPWVIRREVHAIYAERGVPLLRTQWEMVQPDEVLAQAVANPFTEVTSAMRAIWLEKLGTESPDVGLVVLHRDYMEGHTTMLVWGKRESQHAETNRVQE